LCSVAELTHLLCCLCRSAAAIAAAAAAAVCDLAGDRTNATVHSKAGPPALIEDSDGMASSDDEGAVLPACFLFPSSLAHHVCHDAAASGLPALVDEWEDDQFDEDRPGEVL
jgi:hypothetical protein